MHFKFNPRKATQAAAVIARRHGGTIASAKLLRLLYLADRQMLLEHGTTVTTALHAVTKSGPVPSQVLAFVDDGVGGVGPWFDLFEAAENGDVQLRPGVPADTNELSRYEVRLLESFDIEAWARFALVDLHKTLPEWTEPGDRETPISPEAILRAESRPEEEVQRLKAAIADAWFIESGPVGLSGSGRVDEGDITRFCGTCDGL